MSPLPNGSICIHLISIKNDWGWRDQGFWIAIYSSLQKCTLLEKKTWKCCFLNCITCEMSLGLFRISHPIFYDLRERLKGRSWVFAGGAKACSSTCSRREEFAISCWRKVSLSLSRLHLRFLLSSLGGTVYFTRSCHFSETTRGCCFSGG